MTVPYSFQLKDVRRIHEMGGRALVAWEMGIGKTFLSLFYAHRHPETTPVVVVCPAPLKLQWQREAAHHFGVRAEVLSGMTPTEFGIGGVPPMLIVNYEILVSGRFGEGWLKVLKALKPGMVVLDESTAIKDPKAARSKAVKSLCQGVPKVLALSATPIEIKPMELWTTLNILRPEQFPSWWAFGHRYGDPKRTRWGWEFNGASNVDELTEILSDVMVRRRKADVIHHLPSKVRTVVPLELSDREQYDLASTNFLKWLEGVDPSKLSGAVRTAGLAKAGHLKRLAADLKLPAALNWIDFWLSSNDGKILLFCAHKKIVHELKNKYKGTCVTVDGSVTGRKRQDAVDQFQRNAKTRVFIGNMAAAGKGLNLTAAHTVAFLEYGWKPTDHTQAEDRCFARLSDLHGAQIFYLTAANTIEQKIANLLQSRQRIVSRVLDGEGSGESLDLFDMLISEMRVKE